MPRRSRAGRPDRETSVRLTARAWVFLGVGAFSIAAALNTGLSILLSVGALLLVTVLAGAILGRSTIGALTATRTFSADVVHPGDQVTVQLEFSMARSRSRGGISASWSQGLPSGIHLGDEYTPGREGAPVQGTVSVSGGQAERWWFTIMAVRRGVFELGQLRATAVDPFGMVARTRPLVDSAEVTAVPRPVSVPDFEQARTALRSMPHEGAGRGSGTTEDALVREYRVGDPMRRVHWRQTASKGELMVRQDEHAEVAGALVLLDNRLARYPEASGFADSAPSLFAGTLSVSEDFERAVVLAGSALAALDARNAPFAVATTAFAVTPAPAAGLARSARGRRDRRRTLASVRQRGSGRGSSRSNVPHGDVPHTGAHAYDGRSRSGEAALAAAFKDLASVQPSGRETGALDSAGTWAVDASALVVVGATFDSADARRLVDGAPGFDSATVLTVDPLGPGAAGLFAEAGWRMIVDPERQQRGRSW